MANIFDEETKAFTSNLLRGDLGNQSSYFWLKRGRQSRVVDILPQKDSSIPSITILDTNTKINVSSEKGVVPESNAKKYFLLLRELIWNVYNVNDDSYTLELFSGKISANLKIDENFDSSKKDRKIARNFTGFLNLNITKISKKRWCGNFLWERGTFNYGESVYSVSMSFIKDVPDDVRPLGINDDGIFFLSGGEMTKGMR